jgi:6-phosphogluconolactonase
MTRIFRSSSQDEMIAKAAEYLIEKVDSCLKKQTICRVALSGGSTPEPLYRMLGKSPLADHLEWNSIHFFWSDERMVPPDHPESNYRLAYNSLLLPRNILEANIHRLPGELEPDQAAAKSSHDLEMHFLPDLPRFDLILLGIGSDGHTASLFPETKAVIPPLPQSWITANYIPKFDSWRLTFTERLINLGQEILFLAAGKDKAQAAAEIIEGEMNPELYPAQLVQPKDGSVTWFLDPEAASKLRID